MLGLSVIPFGPSLYISDFNLGILYFLAVSSISTYGILIAGSKISPSIMKIIINKLSEFQKILLISKFKAKHIYYEYVCLTTSKINYKNNNFTLSTQDLIFYLHLLVKQTLLLTYLTKWWVKWFKLNFF